MAIGYTNLFEDLGEIVEFMNHLIAEDTTIAGLGTELQTELSGNTMWKVLADTPSLIDQIRDTITIDFIGRLIDLMTDRLQDQVTIIDELPLPAGASLEEIWTELARAMIDDSETINGSVVTVGAVSADAGNVGNGVVLTTKVLDGVTPPWVGGSADRNYLGVDSELAVASETMTLTCETDSEWGAAEGGEEWSQVGARAGSAPYDWRSEGSGKGPPIQTANAESLLSNGEFDLFTSNVPDDWDVDSGTAGTHILKDDSNQFEGDAALQYVGDGAAANIQVSQAIADGTLQPGKQYCIACWVQGEAGIAGGLLEIEFEGTGYTPGSGESIQLNAAALAAQTTYGIEYAFVTMPWTLPDDFKLIVKVSGTLTNAKNVRVDRLVLSPVHWHGGVGCVVVAGDTPFLVGDRFTWDVSNSDAGAFQTVFRRAYRRQLPSNTAGAETISDALASD